MKVSLLVLALGMLASACENSDMGLTYDLAQTANSSYTIATKINYPWGVTRPTYETSDCTVTNVNGGTLVFSATQVVMDAFYTNGQRVNFTGPCSSSLTLPGLVPGDIYLIVSRISGTLVSGATAQSCMFYAVDTATTVGANNSDMGLAQMTMLKSGKEFSGGCGSKF